MKNKMRIAFFLSFFILTFTGCYDNDEIDSLANVVAVGIEQSGNQIGFTFAIADMGSFASAGDDGSKSGSLCYFVQTDDIENAIEEINSRISKKLSFSHMSVILAAKSAARAGITDTVDYFEKMPDVRPQTLIAVSDIKPSEYLEKFNPSLEVNPEKYFLNIFQRSSSYIPVLRMSDYINSVNCTTDVLAPVISGSFSDSGTTEESSYVSGAVLMRKGKMRYEIGDTVTVGLLNSEKNVLLDYNGKEYILYSAEKPKISAEIKGTKTLVNVSLTVGSKSRKFKDNEFLAEKIKTYLTESSKGGYDIFGFSELMKKSFRFQNAYDSYDWRSSLVRCDYTVDVKILYGK